MRIIYLALGWTGGILLAANSDHSAPFLWLLLAVMAIGGAAASWAHHGQRWLLLTLLALSLGGFRYALISAGDDLAYFIDGGGLTLTGVITDPPDRRDQRVLLRVEVETVTRGGRYYGVRGIALVEAPPTTTARYGDRITATGLLSLPGEFDTFSYGDFLARRGIFSVMRGAAVEVIERDSGSPLYAAMIDLRDRAGAIINRALPEPGAGLLNGIILGYEGGIAPVTREAFNATGAAHLIAISGFNMAVLASVSARLLSWTRLPRPIVGAISIALLLIYALFVGANAAVMRAAVMSSLLIVGEVARQRSYVPASLAFVALVMSLINPYVLWDISFQLSFFATLGLALYNAPLTRLFQRISGWLLPPSLAQLSSGTLGALLVPTIAAQILTLPLTIAYFNRLSLVIVPVNLLVVPPQALLLIIGLLATVTGFILPLVSQILFWFTLVLLGWTVTVIQFFAALPFAEIELRVDPRLIILFYITLLGIAMTQAARPSWAIRIATGLRSRAILSGTLFAGLFTLTLLAAVYASRPDGRLHIWLLDMGHSNATLIQTPDGAHILVDGGNFPTRLLTALGERLPFHDQHIDLIIISQPDENEYGALTAVLDRYSVGQVLTSGQPNASDAYQTLMSRMAEEQHLIVGAGHSIDFSDGVIIDFLHPQRTPDLGDSLDDHALVLQVRYGDSSLLLTGDLSADGQRALLESGGWPVATLLQLPRHGTARGLNADFLAAVQPQIALLQSDRANRRGDPDPDVLALLGDIPLYRTDAGGAIHIATDGHELWIAQAGR